jgi:hypothetical protein
MNRIIAIASLTACLAGACSTEESSFDGQRLVFPDDFPMMTTKDLDAGDQGGYADWYEISGIVPGVSYNMLLDLSPAEGDDLHFTVVRSADGFGPQDEYCTGLASAEQSGPSCSFTADAEVVYMYVARGFVEEGVEEVDYSLSLLQDAQ